MNEAATISAAKAPPYHSANRTRKRCESSLNRANGIAAASHGLNERFGHEFVELVAEPIDMHLDDVRRSFPIRFPEVLAKHLAGDDLPGVSHQHLQQAELGRRQIDL